MPGGASVGFPELLTQMKITNRLLAGQLKSTMRQIELIALLASTGATQQEIAEVLDTTAATVNTTLQRLKRQEGSQGKRMKKSVPGTGSRN